MCTQHGAICITHVGKHVCVLQGVHIPRLLAEGTCHRGLAAFIATEAGGDSLSIEMLRSRLDISEKVVPSLAAVHQLGCCMEMCSCTILWLRLMTQQFGCWTLNIAAAGVSHTS